MAHETPVALIIFNRPDTTSRVWQRLEISRPRLLFVIADGPRPGRGEDGECEAARKVTEKVSWRCEVVRMYSDVNLGCGKRVSSGLDWVFENVDRAIVLEDDCVPDLSFFPYADDLLDRFAEDERVMSVSGDNFQETPAGRGYSYYFSRYTHIWGWATWARAWRHFDLKMALWPTLRDGGWLRDVLGGDENACLYWSRIFERTHRREIDAWGYQWCFACWAQGGLTVLPDVNLVENIGFDSRATHTRSPANEGHAPRAGSINLPLRHPPFLIRNSEADSASERKLFSGVRPRTPSGLERLYRALRTRLLSRGGSLS